MPDRMNTITVVRIVKWYFSNVENDHRGVFETRGFACEIVAWRFLSHLSKHELIEYLLREIPPVAGTISERSSEEGGAPASRPRSVRMASNDQVNERSRLLFEDSTRPKPRPRIHEPQELHNAHTWGSTAPESVDDDPTASFVGLNALEIATVAGAKHFLSQNVVQDVVNGIWSGDIIFWESLTTHTRKRAQKYNPRKADLFCRLRVPKYQKAFEAAFFASFLILYYAVLVERNPRHITVAEILLYTWIAAFACDEFGEFQDAGTLFYAADFWSFWDIGIIGIGVAYLTKDFVKFLGIVIILFFGFLTTFTMLARDSYSAKEIWWMMVNVFFGSSYLGFVMDHAREEYLFQYSVFVLEASASRRLTYYFPPLNLIPLILFRPLRLCISSEQLRNARIMVLRATHIPYVAAIWLYEKVIHHWNDRRDQWLRQTGPLKLSMLANHTSFSHKAIKYSVMKDRSDASLMVKTPGSTSEGRSYFAKDPDAAAEIKGVLEKLTTQGEMIEKLSRQVEKLTRPHPPSPKAKADS
ncbi:MAG: hypothetical protein Q9208_000124 [Pyrenodesmia sp. 3 TL-2023]